MRIIKYRGKSISNGQWVYGYYVHNPYAHTHWIWSTDKHDLVDPASVGDFTGLRDNKRTPEFPEGQDIYEGDIVRLKYGTDGQWHENLIVSWLQYGFFAREFWSKHRDPCPSWEGYSLDATEIQVIGNVHDTPEAQPIPESGD